MIIFVDILITDSVRHAGEVLKTLPFFSAATLVVYHILIKIREKNQCFDSTLGGRA